MADSQEKSNVIEHNFSGDDKTLCRINMDAKLLYCDENVWLVRNTVTINGKTTITHQIIELPQKE